MDENDILAYSRSYFSNRFLPYSDAEYCSPLKFARALRVL